MIGPHPRDGLIFAPVGITTWHLAIKFYERTTDNVALTCEELANAERCSPHSVYNVGFLPAGGTLTVDGQVGRATVECVVTAEPSPDV